MLTGCCLCWLTVVYVDWLLAASQHKHKTYTICCIYRLVPPDDEQYACSKHAEVNYWNKFEVNSASCWFLLNGYFYLSTRLLALSRLQQEWPTWAYYIRHFRLSLSFLTDVRTLGTNERTLKKFDIIGGIVGMFQCGLKPDERNGHCFNEGEPCTVQQPFENLQTLNGKQTSR